MSIPLAPISLSDEDNENLPAFHTLVGELVIEIVNDGGAINRQALTDQLLLRLEHVHRPQEAIHCTEALELLGKE
ncbi:hypothetical protein LU196_13440 [Pantoea sp. Mb-10]|uniref:hypothetical protein n=1 Tax=unclassified Pantoea TaxID=2630326 RepID=UPI001E58F41D|nr:MULTISPECIES: hypothetical protein [unclassified Pantoea]MCE0491045.1 hypothetical protein [Pantoea sp. Mb-10]MCE0502534.1 hypothetical protein [Pantoea sp. Pb-8]